ncbi:hypothetical protein Trydic_g13225 [Trypoxylus dichotomus]
MRTTLQNSDKSYALTKVIELFTSVECCKPAILHASPTQFSEFGRGTNPPLCAVVSHGLGRARKVTAEEPGAEEELIWSVNYNELETGVEDVMERAARNKCRSTGHLERQGRVK